MTTSKSLKLSYKKYRKKGNDRERSIGFLRSFMPEIIFRTTKLEGESVTRKLVKAIFT